MFRLAFFVSLLTSIVHAELRWDQPIQEFDCTRDERQVAASFTFRNVGSAPVTIRSIKSSCGCTTVELPKKTYAAGESGEVRAKFSFGFRTGPQRKIITVKTDDGAGPTLLDFRVMIRERVAITPTLLFWRIGEATESKSAQITINGEAMQVHRVTSSNPRVNVALQTVAPGAKYAVVVTPLDTSRRESAAVQIHTDFPRERPRSYPIHVRIK